MLLDYKHGRRWVLVAVRRQPCQPGGVMAPAAKKKSHKSGAWHRLWLPTRRWWLLGIPAGGFLALIAGAAGLGAFNYTLHQTSTNEFCFTCHSHERFIRPEYEASSHFNNRTGVSAQCADCHLPHGWFALAWTKAVVSLDVVPELLGKLDTKEKYEAHRGEMAKSVWQQFRANDSEFCRHCHNSERMDFSLQERSARRHHTQAQEKGESCIECHQGIVHALPEDWRELWE